MLPPGEFQESAEGEDLEGTGDGDVEGSGPSLADVGELCSVGGDCAREAESGAGGDLAQEGELADAAVLQLDEAEAVETLLVGIIEQAKGIEEAKRILS